MGHHVNLLKPKPLIAGVLLLGLASPAFANPVVFPGGPFLAVSAAGNAVSLLIGLIFWFI